MRNEDYTAMTVPVVGQGGGNTTLAPRVHVQEYSGDHTLRTFSMDQKAKGSFDNGLQNRHHPILAWQQGVEEGSASSVESSRVGDMAYPAPDASLPMFQKLRGGGLHISDPSGFSEDEDAADIIQDGSPLAHAKRRMHVSHHLAHTSAASNVDDVAVDQMSTHSEDYASQRVKFLCSYGGKILPRPNDGQLRYVGGDTRLITVNRDISYLELLNKVSEFYSQAGIIKYKLPEEDLDSLVSVLSDEDLANMMEEYDKLEASEGSSRLRLFLFPDGDHDFGHANDSLGDQRNNEQRYVDAVNGIPETSSRKHSEAGSVSMLPLMTDSLIDAPDPWPFVRSQETVPVALLAPQISQDVASLIQHVPVALPVSSVPLVAAVIPSKSNAASAPSSAPSSPPLLPRGLKQVMVPEFQLPYFPDQHSKMSGYSYNLGQSDGTSLDLENYGGNVQSGANLHDHFYKNSDARRAPESPTKMQHKGALTGGHQEHIAREESRRLGDGRMARVSSHGKLTRLSEHQSEGTAAVRQRHGYQQPQQQGAWPPHLLEVQSEGYNRRVDHYQPNTEFVLQPTALGQQQQSVQFRGLFQNTMPPPPSEVVYRPVDHQSQGEEVFAPFMQRSISAHTMGPPLGSVATNSYNIGVGSAPTSPRMAYRDPSNRLPAGQSQSQSQSQQVHRAYGPMYSDPQHGRRHLGHSDSSTRLRPSTSPPRYRDHLGHTEDRLHRSHQQPSLLPSDPLQQEHFVYDMTPIAHSQYADGTTRSQLSQYQGQNPFQDNLSVFSDPGYPDHQDGGDGRRLPLYRGEKIVHQPFHPAHLNAYQDLNPAGAESLPVHSRPQEKPIDWLIQQDEPRSRLAGAGWPGTAEYVDEGGTVEFAPLLHILDAHGGNYLHLPEDSDALLAPAVAEPYLHRKAEWEEPSELSNFALRGSISQSSALPAYSSSLGRTVTDGTQAGPYLGRVSETNLYPEPTSRPRENLPDFESTPTLSDMGGRVLSSVSNPNTLAGHMLPEDTAATVAFNHMVPHLSSYSQNARNMESVNAAELRWGGQTGSDDSRVEGLPHARDQANSQDRLQQLSVIGAVQGQVSRPSSGTTLDALGDGGLHGLHSGSVTAQSNETLVEDDAALSAFSLHSTVISDRPTPPSIHQSTSAGQTQLPQSMTSKMTSFTVPTRSIQVSTESLIPTIPTLPTSVNTSTSYSEQVPTIPSILFEPAVPASRMSEGEFGKSSGLNIEVEKESNKAFLSQLSATGHLAEDMASSVLRGSGKVLTPLQALNKTQEEGKGAWLTGSQDATAVLPAPLISSPTFAMQNWEKNLAALDAEEEDEQDRHAAEGSISERDVHEVQSPIVEVQEEPVAMVPTIKEATADLPGSVGENLKKSDSNPDTAVEAEAEAISRGLQTILNADLEEMRELGSGTFGTVYHGKWRGTDVAIKRIKASCFAGRPAERDRLIADFWREACTLGQLHHPNVVAFYGVVRDGPGGTLATVTEYMVNGSLKQVLHKKDRTIDRRKRLLIAMDAAFGMEYLHSKNIVHFDLKCDNLLVNMRDPHRPICKVGDLGLSKVKHQTMVSGGVRGTLPWMAPELLNGSSSMVTEKVDVFSFGIVMWELLTGEEPYANMHYGAIIGGIVNNTLRPKIPTWCDPVWKSLMERCWSAEPSSRPSFTEVASELRGMAAALQPKPHDGR